MKQQREKPEPKDYGYEDGGIEEPTGWSIEGGEEAYFDALKKYNSNLEMKLKVRDLEIVALKDALFMRNQMIQQLDILNKGL